MNLLDSLISRLTGAAYAPDSLKTPQSSMPATSMAPDTDLSAAMRSRRDLLRIALRDIKATIGIPADWLQIRVLGGTSPRRGPGFYASLVVKHWHPLLMLHAPAIERMLVQRVVLIDPLATDWLMGMSWKFELDDGVDLEPLPPRGAWLEQALAGSPAVHEMGVISGPVLIPDWTPSARDRVNVELMAGDAQPRNTTGMEPTRPARLD
jgi:hypothetical protein